MERAGDVAMRYFRQPLDIYNKAAKRSFDPVTRADREVEAMIRERIGATYPDHGIHGEEEGRTGTECSYTWIIDPIDGTRGYICGSPMWGMLLGLKLEDQCLLGVMHQPYLQETWYGSKDGAFTRRDGATQPLRCSTTTQLSEAVICCTHPSMFRNEDDAGAFHGLERRCRYSRYGTECLGYGLLAAGYVDLVVEADLEAYDIAPLIPIVKAAGGVVSNWDGGGAHDGGRVLAAANPQLHARALDLIRRAT